MKKRLFALAAAAVMVLGLTACGGGSNEGRTGDTMEDVYKRQAWFILLTVQIAGYAAILLLSAGLGLMVGIAGLVGIIWFLAALWKCAKRCEDLPPKDGGLGEL